jgi:hypothetical protein
VFLGLVEAGDDGGNGVTVVFNPPQVFVDPVIDAGEISIGDTAGVVEIAIAGAGVAP